jgi:predicted CopG family antitoxin
VKDKTEEFAFSEEERAWKMSILVHGSCVATKTISLELDAYEKLKMAKRGRESFSAVVRRCSIPDAPMTGKELLEYYHSRTEFFSDEELDSIEAVRRNEPAFVSPWEEES